MGELEERTMVSSGSQGGGVSGAGPGAWRWVRLGVAVAGLVALMYATLAGLIVRPGVWLWVAVFASIGVVMLSLLASWWALWRAPGKFTRRDLLLMLGGVPAVAAGSYFVMAAMGVMLTLGAAAVGAHVFTGRGAAVGGGVGGDGGGGDGVGGGGGDAGAV